MWFQHSPRTVFTIQMIMSVTQDKLQAAFRMFDKDGSGLVSAEELAGILQQGGTTDFYELVK